jgi:transcriptional antiterminator NusG
MKKWYVIQVLAGYEDRIRADLLKSIEEKGLQDKFGEILIPSAKAKSSFEEAQNPEEQYLFPGYMLVELEPVQESLRLVTQTPRVSRFLGGQRSLSAQPLGDRPCTCSSTWRGDCFS